MQKKWNSAYLLMNDNTNHYDLIGTTTEGDSVTLFTDATFRQIMLSKYYIFNMLPGGYYDEDQNRWISLVNSKADAITYFKNLFTTWMTDKKDGYLKLYEALRAAYNPLNNYDKTIHSTMEYSGTETNTFSPTGLESVTLTKSGKELRTETPSGSESTVLTKSGTETTTETPSGTETKTLTKSGSETITETPSGTETKTLTKTGAETTTETPTGQESVQHSIGQAVSTSAKTTFDSSTFLDTERQTDAARTNTDTTSFNQRQTETALAFTNREDSEVTSFDDRQTETETSFTNRQDAEVTSFTNRQTEVETSFDQRQDESVLSFNNRKTEDELSFTNRQDTEVKSFTNRQDESVKSFDDRIDEYNLTEEGNIGIRSSQEMIMSQLPVTEIDRLQHYIINDFVHNNLII